MEFKISRGDPIILIDMLRVITSMYDSRRTNLRAPEDDPNVGKRAAQGNDQQQD